MKNIFFSLALLAFGFTNAQIKDKGTFEITPKVGTSSFTEYGDEGSTNSISGVEFGATVDYYFNNRWSLRSGLIFDKMGGKYSYTTNYSLTPSTGFETSKITDYYEDKLYYLSIPVNANWHFGSTRKWNLNFGLSPSFLTNAEFDKNGTTYDIPKDIIKSFQLGLTFGIGYKIEITKKFGILIDAQWFNGLTNINKTGINDTTNAGFSFNVGGVIQL
jgi:long-subunit fatty acid transport protein